MHGTDGSGMHFGSREFSARKTFHHESSPRLLENVAHGEAMVQIHRMILLFKITVAVGFGCLILALL
jgi:hypothetical protein